MGGGRRTPPPPNGIKRFLYIHKAYIILNFVEKSFRFEVLGLKNGIKIWPKILKHNLYLLYVQEVVTQPKTLKRTILSNLVHVT